ncbi:extracellular solute-binding protein [Tepidibacillus marianensis]|uniref:sugar ABC transporter substrate-binding protein n=1 Tax=Tepidibacillus marianensis TaxID=3131995 RepID=UPI0030D22065
MKRIYSILIIVVSVFILLSGCGLTNPSKSNQTAVQAPKPTKLVIWEDTGKRAVIDSVISSFSQKYGIQVEVREIDSTKSIEQLKQEGPAGTAPDVITMSHEQLGQAVTLGLVMPLLTDKTVANQYTDSAIKAMTYKGQLFGLPRSVDAPILIYNKNLLNQPPTTMDELYTFSQGFTKNGYFGFLAPWDQFRYASGVLNGFGGYIFGEKEGIPTSKNLGLNQQGAVTGLEYIQKWYGDGLFPTEIIGATGLQMIDTLFTSNRVAAVMNDSRALTTYQNAGINYGIAPLPTLTNGKPIKTLMNVNGWFVTAYSSHQDWAMKLVAELASPDHAKNRLTANGEVPPIKSFNNDSTLLSNELAKAIYTQSLNSEPTPNLPEMAQVWDPMNRALQLTITNRLTPQNALDEAVKTIQQQIQTTQ